MENRETAETVVVDVQTEPEIPKPRARVRRDGATAKDTKGKGKQAAKPELTPEIVKAATAGWKDVLGMVITAGQMFAPGFAPTQEEAEGITVPASRLLGRHYPLPDLSEDARDGAALIMGLGMWGYRVAFTRLNTDNTGQAPPTGPSPVEPAPSPRQHANGSTGPSPSQEFRAAQPGEGTGVPVDELVGDPNDVLSRLYEAAQGQPVAEG